MAIQTNYLFCLFFAQVEVVVGDLGAANFGLGDAQWEELGAHVDVIVHLGACMDQSSAGLLLLEPILLSMAFHALAFSLRA